MEKPDKSLPRASSLRSGRALSRRRPRAHKRPHKRRPRQYLYKLTCQSCKKGSSQVRAEKKPRFCPACGADAITVSRDEGEERRFLQSLTTLALINIAGKLLNIFAPNLGDPFAYPCPVVVPPALKIAAPPERSEEARRQQPKKTDIQ